jgi:hypothetical protein
MSFARRKSAEIHQKLASLDAELTYWRKEAAPDGPLEKHHTQVEAISNEVSTAAAAVQDQIAASEGDTVLAQAAAFESVILDLHRLWDLFRSKLALRYVAHFNGYLRGADELAYSCYRRAEARGANREPALLYFGGERSPIIRPPGATLEPASGRARDSLSEPLRRLPVPLIGLPWYQVTHLPDAPVIAHEVGHDVELDLDLAPTVTRVVDAALVRAGVEEARRRGWATWRPELFADVFATLALGPAYTATLADFLGEPRAVAREFQGDPVWRRHPPRTLRVLLSCATLDAMGFSAAAERLRSEWSGQFPAHPMRAFAPDVRWVAAAIIAGPYSALADGPLTQLIALSPEMWESARQDAARARQAIALRGSDARVLIAAARIAFDEDPDGYRSSDISARILRRIEKEQAVGTRAGPATPVREVDRAARDELAGRWLAGHLMSAHGLPPSMSAP